METTIEHMDIVTTVVMNKWFVVMGLYKALKFVMMDRIMDKQDIVTVAVIDRLQLLVEMAS